MRKLFLTLALAGLLLCAVAPSASANGSNNHHKVWVCKYVGQPGDFETLKAGKQPIQVDVSAANDFVGADFADGQTHSYVIDLVTESNTDRHNDYTGDATCPTPPPSTTSTTTSTTEPSTTTTVESPTTSTTIVESTTSTLPPTTTSTVPDTTTTTEAPTTTTTVEVTTTTAPPETTTTQAPTTSTTQPSASTTTSSSIVTVTTVPSSTTPSTSGPTTSAPRSVATTPVPSAGPLPFTGSSSGVLWQLGIVLFLAGCIGLTAVGGRKVRR